ncbi:thiamine monophosphate synthase [bacterium]|nr:thiamine monophosphate synthase [bacterium]
MRARISSRARATEAGGDTPFMAIVQAQARLRRKLCAAARTIARRRRPGATLPAAFLFTDPARKPDPRTALPSLPRGWGVVYRHFGAGNRHEDARRLAKLSRRRGLPLLIGSDPELARTVQATGVHWASNRLPRRSARRPDHRPGGHTGGLLTAAAHSGREITRAAKAGVDAVFVSSVFDSASASAGRPMGPHRFLRLAARSPVAIYALGGLDASTIGRLCIGQTIPFSGWASIAGITAAFGSSNGPA